MERERGDLRRLFFRCELFADVNVTLHVALVTWLEQHFRATEEIVLASCSFLPIPQQIKPYQHLFRERKRAKRHVKGRMASSNPNLEVGLKPTRTRRDEREERRDPHEA